MQIRVLGCHGADCLVDGTERLVRQESCGFLIDNSVLLDGGTIGTRLTLAEQCRIRFVLLSHLHFDHIKGLPLLADNLAEWFVEPVTVAATEPVIQGLIDHVFNDKVYPNFFQLPSREHPILQARVLHSGDTYQTEDIWSLGQTTPELKAAFIEASFPDELGKLAQKSKHLTPSLFLKEFQKLRRPSLPVYAYHMKPPYQVQIKEEISRLGIERVGFLEEGQIINV